MTLRNSYVFFGFQYRKINRQVNFLDLKIWKANINSRIAENHFLITKVDKIWKTILLCRDFNDP